MTQTQDQFDTLHERVASVEAAQASHMAQTARIEANTSELIELINAFKGAWKVLNWIGKAAKPLGYISSAVGALFYFKDHLKDWILK